MNKNNKFIICLLVPIVFIMLVLSAVFFSWTAWKNKQYVNKKEDSRITAAYNYLKDRYPKVNKAYKINEIKKGQTESMQLVTLTGQGFDAKFLVDQGFACYVGPYTKSQEVYITDDSDCAIHMVESCQGDIKCSLGYDNQTYRTNLDFFLRRIGVDDNDHDLRTEYTKILKNSILSIEEMKVESVDFLLESLGETGGMMGAGFKVFLNDEEPLSIQFLGGLVS